MSLSKSHSTLVPILGGVLGGSLVALLLLLLLARYRRSRFITHSVTDTSGRDGRDAGLGSGGTLRGMPL